MTGYDESHKDLGCLTIRGAYFDIAELWNNIKYDNYTRAHICDNQRCCAYTDRTSYMLLIGLALLTLLFIIIYSCSMRRYHKTSMRNKLQQQTAAVDPVVTTNTAQPSASQNNNQSIKQSLLTSTDYNQIYDDCYNLLLPVFNTHNKATQLTQYTSTHITHVNLQLNNLTLLLTQHVIQCNYNISRAIQLMHSRTLAAYKSWCNQCNVTPIFSNNSQLDDIVEYVMIWSVSEQLRRVPSLLSTLYHNRTNKQYNIHQIIQQNQCKLNHYEVDYDDLDDMYRTVPTFKQRLYRIYDTLYSPSTHPRTIGYLSLIRILYPIIQLHVFLAICCIAVIRNAQYTQSQTGLIDFYIYFTTTTSLYTLLQCAQADSILLLIGQLVDIFCTVTIRVRHIIIILISCICMAQAQLSSSIPIFGLISSTMNFISFDLPFSHGIEFGRTYIVLRILLIIFTYIVIKCTPKYSIHAASVYTPVTPPANSNQFNNQQSQLIISSQPQNTMDDNHTDSDQYSILCCCKNTKSCRTVWRSAQCIGFWCLIIVCKLLFDTYILFPSVAGISLQSLCSTSLSDLLFSSVVPLNLGQLRHVVNAGNVVVVSPLDSPYSHNIACPIFEAILWCITGLISVATSYVIYVLCLAVVGSVIPHVYNNTTIIQRRYISIGIVIWWCAVMCILVAGHIISAILMTLTFALIAKLYDTYNTTNTPNKHSSTDNRPFHSAHKLGIPLNYINIRHNQLKLNDTDATNDDKSSRDSNSNLQSAIKRITSIFTPADNKDIDVRSKLHNNALLQLSATKYEHLTSLQIVQRYIELLTHHINTSNKLIISQQSQSSMTSRMNAATLRNSIINFISTRLHDICIVHDVHIDQHTLNTVVATLSDLSSINQHNIASTLCYCIIAVVILHQLSISITVSNADDNNLLDQYVFEYNTNNQQLASKLSRTLNVMIGMHNRVTDQSSSWYIHVLKSKQNSTITLIDLLQPVFTKSINDNDVMLCWNMFISRWRRLDLCSNNEVSAILSTYQCNSYTTVHLQCNELQRRIQLFIASTVLLQQQQLTHHNLNSIKSITIIIPIYNETVYYTHQQLIRPINSTATQHNSYQFTLIDYIVSKHVHEFNNLAERINFNPCVSHIHNTTNNHINGLSNTAINMLLWFKSNEFTVNNAEHQQYIDDIIEFCSLRGQTLVRTVHGLNELYYALRLHCMVECTAYNHMDIDKFVQSKIQILVSAQRYGIRSDRIQRAAFNKLMKQYPNIELVYDYNLLDDIDNVLSMAITTHQQSISDNHMRQARYNTLTAIDLDSFILPINQPICDLQVHNPSSHRLPHQSHTNNNINALIGAATDILQKLLDTSTSVLPQLTECNTIYILLQNVVCWQYLLQIVQYQLSNAAHLLQSCIHIDPTTSPRHGTQAQLKRDYDIIVQSIQYIQSSTSVSLQCITRYTQLAFYLQLCYHQCKQLQLQFQLCTGNISQPLYVPYKTNKHELCDRSLIQAIQLAEQRVQYISTQCIQYQIVITRQCQLLDDILSVLIQPYISTAQSTPYYVLDSEQFKELKQHIISIIQLIKQHSNEYNMSLRCTALYEMCKSIHQAARYQQHNDIHSIRQLNDMIQNQLSQLQLSVQHTDLTTTLNILHKQCVTAQQSVTNLQIDNQLYNVYQLIHKYVTAHQVTKVAETITFTDVIHIILDLATGCIQQYYIHMANHAVSLQFMNVSINNDHSVIHLLINKLMHNLTSHLQQAIANISHRQFTQSVPDINTSLNKCLIQSICDLAEYNYYSVHCRYNQSNSNIQVLHSIGRNMPLLLGSLKDSTTINITELSAALPTTNPKSENQLHCIPFATGQIIQAIDMNGDFYIEQAIKYIHMMNEFNYNQGTDIPEYVLVGCPEHIYSESDSAIGHFMGLQDHSFVTIVQRTLAYTGVRLHYGHPDMIDGYYCRYTVGLSKASAVCNLSEDLFLATEMMLRSQYSTYCEYIYYGKGREVNLLGTSIFENKLSRGAAQTLISTDMYRIIKSTDSITSLSFLYGSIGHYFYTVLFDYTITSFVWLLILMSLAHVDSERVGLLGSVYAIPWLLHLGMSFFQ